MEVNMCLVELLLSQSKHSLLLHVWNRTQSFLGLSFRISMILRILYLLEVSKKLACTVPVTFKSFPENLGMSMASLWLL